MCSKIRRVLQEISYNNNNFQNNIISSQIHNENKYKNLIEI